MAVSAQKKALFEKVRIALSFSGWRLLWLEYANPAKARLIREDDAVDVWIHIWNLTPGGRQASMPNEYRIQPTGIGSSFTAEQGAKTLILGWSEDYNVFAAFDYNYHSGTFGASPSIQTDTKALEEAISDGLGVYSKDTGELAVAIRPELLGFYVIQMDALHSFGKDAVELATLKNIASSPLAFGEVDLPQSSSPERQRAMTQTLRWLRDHRFTERVLTAYSNRCAMCEVQLSLLDAAHILPVAHPDSDDEVSNGIALCALHHRAYDAALVTFDEEYEIRFNEDAIGELQSEGLSNGLSAFKSAIRPSIELPSDPDSHPSPDMIGKANDLRGWN
ncbi:HNH endonuclease [Qipengyuania aquimaris]|uniref:HNH endonuclease n=1 Tax=Qipengyuania aquimaris TaxID=255984 RepID=A0A9Q3XCZ8_9SPHN|nr:HNH endonuclease [Qipengyuania aquimaris]MBY6218768.1 HNH endonuclease [Qipengyuania aquimaris]